MIYIDELKQRGARYATCHMLPSGLEQPAIEELHAFAATIGLKRSWFHDSGKYPHYDLGAGYRLTAVLHGAVETTSRNWLREHRVPTAAAQAAALARRERLRIQLAADWLSERLETQEPLLPGSIRPDLARIDRIALPGRALAPTADTSAEVQLELDIFSPDPLAFSRK